MDLDESVDRSVSTHWPLCDRSHGHSYVVATRKKKTANVSEISRRTCIPLGHARGDASLRVAGCAVTSLDDALLSMILRVAVTHHVVVSVCLARFALAPFRVHLFVLRHCDSVYGRHWLKGFDAKRVSMQIDCTSIANPYNRPQYMDLDPTYHTIDNLTSLTHQANQEPTEVSEKDYSVDRWMYLLPVSRRLTVTTFPY